MSKYCPDDKCGFYDKYRRGYPNVRARNCPYCGKELILKKQIEAALGAKDIYTVENLLVDLTEIPDSDTSISINKDVTPIPSTSTNEHPNIKTEPQTQIIDKVVHDKDKHTDNEKDTTDKEKISDNIHLPMKVKVLSDENPAEEEKRDEAVVRKSDNKRKCPDSNSPELNQSQKKQRTKQKLSDSESTTSDTTRGHKPIVPYSPITDSSTDSDTNEIPKNTTQPKSEQTTDKLTASSVAEDNKDEKKRKREKEEEIREAGLDVAPRKSLRLADKGRLEISENPTSAIPESETPSVNIQFKTLILKEFYSKIESIHLKILSENIGNMKNSIELTKFTDVKLLSGEFVTLCGTLKYPISSINCGYIWFPYRYCLIHSDANESFEDLHNELIHNYMRCFNWKVNKTLIDSLNNNTYLQYDMMILPEISKDSTLFGLFKKAFNFFTGSDREFPFKNLSERRSTSLQVLLLSNFDTESSLSYYNPGQFIDQFIFLVDELIRCYFTYPDNAVAFWESYSNRFHLSPEHLIKKLVIDWIQARCEYNTTIDLKSKVYHFYLSCYLIQHYKLNNEGLNLKLIEMIKESIEPILSGNYCIFDNIIPLSTGEDLRTTIYISIIEFIFKR
ncbi:hypothetical protein LOD99_7364 [Oopsacas minuta]|uniref:Uncharacterized protein n=1 Tax=Oopsacas minuta TaxID=111878 RepID=A0AAV7JUH2_9METZ|nr:hypothetical protein LOD99_7364 [Oopsacas minuta]